MNNSLLFYQQPGLFSAINQEGNLLKSFPQDIKGLFQLTQSLVVHENECQWANYDFAKNRYDETNIRSVSEMLKKVLELSFKNQALTHAHPLEKRLIASCRGASLLLVALLRANNIPARLKIGFVTYHPIARFNMDHVIVEYFDRSEKQSKWADLLLTEEHLAKNLKAKKINPLDLNLDDFIPVEQVWKKIRSGNAIAQNYGIGLFKNRRGLFAVRNKLMHECAVRLKYEMLPGDLWGYMLFDGPQIDPEDEKQLSAMDELAELLIQDKLSDINNFYQANSAFKIPSIVINHHSILGTTAQEIKENICH